MFRYEAYVQIVEYRVDILTKGYTVPRIVDAIETGEYEVRHDLPLEPALVLERYKMCCIPGQTASGHNTDSITDPHLAREPVRDRRWPGKIRAQPHPRVRKCGWAVRLPGEVILLETRYDGYGFSVLK